MEDQQGENPIPQAVIEVPAEPQVVEEQPVPIRTPAKRRGKKKEAVQLPVVTFGKDVVQSFLTLDNEYRKKRVWPLVSCESFMRMNEDFAAVNLQPAQSLCRVYTYYRRNTGKPDMEHLNNTSILDGLNKMFPHASKILEAGKGHLVAAGGAIVDQVINFNQRRYPRGDLDFFLIGVKESEAEAFLEGVISSVFGSNESDGVVEHHGDEDDDEVDDGGEDWMHRARVVHPVLMMRSEHAISVSVRPKRSYYDAHVYQFILRIYGSISEVLGGFDLPVCACGFSLENGLQLTPLCAFNLVTKSVFLDSSRRSTSYETRLSKYRDRGIEVVITSVDFARLQARDENAEPVNMGRAMLRVHSNYDGTSYCVLRVPGQYDHEFEVGPDGDYGPDAHPAVLGYGNIIRAASNKSLSSVVLMGRSFRELMDRPSLPGGLGVQRLYLDRARRNHAVANIPVLELYSRWFGEDVEDFVLAKLRGDRTRAEQVATKTATRIEQTLKKYAESINGPLHFTTIDPGRQYTGSFNPILEPASSYYPADVYDPTYVGLPSPAHEVAIRQAFAPFRLPKDIVRLLFSWIVVAFAQDTLVKAGLATFLKY